MAEQLVKKKGILVLEDIQLHFEFDEVRINRNEFSESLLSSVDLRVVDFMEHKSLVLCDGIFIRQQDHYKKILYTDILWVEASRSYSYIHQVNQKKQLVTHPLREIEDCLPKPLFIRIHRSFLVNLNYVDAFIGNMLCIRGQNLPISTQYRKIVRAYFNFLETKECIGKAE